MESYNKLRTSWMRAALISAILLLVMMMAIGSAAVSYAEEGGGGDPVRKLELLDFEDGTYVMGKLQKGYTKAEARDLKLDVKVMNSGNTTLNIDPKYFTVGNSAEFTYSAVGEVAELKPGETATIGWVQPKHEMDAGYHYARVDFHDADYNDGTFIYGYVMYMVVSEDCDVLVTKHDYADSLKSVDLGTEVKGYAKGSTVTLDAVNMTTSGVRFNITSDSELFNIKYKNPEDTPETVVESLYSIPFDVTVDSDIAASLGVGEYTGNITVTATLENGEEVDEKVLPVKYKITGVPRWQDEEVTWDVIQDYWSYNPKTLPIVDFESGDTPRYKYVSVEVKEGAENFTAEIYNDVKLRFKKAPEPGTYDVELDLYFDSEGKGGKGDYCGTCKVKVNVVETGKYDLEIMNGDTDYGEVELGTLFEGYGEEEAAQIGQKLIVKNIGKENLEMSGNGFKVESGKAYLKVKCNSVGSKTVRPGKEYTGIEFQPETGLKPGSYEVSISFRDDEGKTVYGDSLDIYFNVVEDGMQLDLMRYESIFDPEKPIGEDGLDLGIFSPDPEAKDKNTYIDFSNTGSVKLNVTASIENDENGIFGLSKGSASIKSLDFSTFTLTTKLSKATEPGIYTAVMKVTAKNAEDETEQINIDVPIKLTISNDNKCKITVDFQGKGDGEYENTTMEFVKGTPYSKALTEIMRKVMKVSYGNIPWPTDDDYTMIAMTFKKDDELKDWDDTIKSQKEVTEGVAEGDKTVYVNWAKKIDKVAFSVDVPKCGEVIGNVLADIPEGAHYILRNGAWSADEEEDIFVIGRSYGYDIRIGAEFGYAFSKDTAAFINGRRAVNNTSATDTMHMDLSGKAVVSDHLYGDATPAGEKVHILKCPGCGSEKKEAHVFDDGVVTTKPTCDEYGEITYTCESCGYERYELADPLGHEWKCEVKTKTDDEKYGLIEGVCERCEEEMEDEFFYTCTEGSDQTWYQGSDRSLRFTFLRFDFDDDYDYKNSLTGIRIDDKVYPANGPDRSYGITIFGEKETSISLYKSLLKELAEGSHTITCLFEDGESDIVKFNVVKSEMIDTIDVAINAPVCGETASRIYNERKGIVITNPPVVTTQDGAAYTVDMSTMYPPYWTDENISEFWSGTFKGGETYYAFFCLRPNEGFVFSREEDPERSAVPFKGTVRVNGKVVTPIKTSSFLDNMRFVVPVEAVHDWDEVVTKEPTYTKEGSKEKTCKACGEKVTEVIPKLAKLKNTMTVKTSKKTVKTSDLKKKSVKVKPIKVKKPRGKVTYKIAGGKKKAKKVLKLNKKNGKITVKKGTGKGTYKLKIRVRAAGTSKYKAMSKKVTITVKVR